MLNYLLFSRRLFCIVRFARVTVMVRKIITNVKKQITQHKFVTTFVSNKKLSYRLETGRQQHISL